MSYNNNEFKFDLTRFSVKLKICALYYNITSKNMILFKQFVQ